MDAGTQFLPIDVEPLTISYEGILSEDGIDMADLAKSLDGYSRIIATTCSFALTMTHVRHIDAMPVRTRVTSVKGGSLHIAAVIHFIEQAKLVEAIGPVVKTMMEWVLSKISKQDKTDESKQAVMMLLEQHGAMLNQLLERDRVSLQLERLAYGLIPAARNASTPIGANCNHIRLAIGSTSVSTWNEADRRSILEQEQSSIQPVQKYTIFISELDVENCTAKVSFNESDSDRVRAKISDPSVTRPNNHYATCLADQSPCVVTAKAEILDGRIAILHISDCELPLPPDPTDAES